MEDDSARKGFEFGIERASRILAEIVEEKDIRGGKN